MESTSMSFAPVDRNGDGRWMSMHERFKSEAFESQACDILFIGDSIVQQLQFTRFYKTNLPKGKNILNFGIGGDRVENVLWRVQDEKWLEHLKPKVVVLFVGTNNIGSTPLEIVNMLDALLKVIFEKTPSSCVILPLLLPKGQHPNRLREKNNKTNDLIIQKFDNNQQSKNKIFIVDMEKDRKIIEKDGTISSTVLHDYLHLTEEGYTFTWINVLKKCEDILNSMKF